MSVSVNTEIPKVEHDVLPRDKTEDKWLIMTATV